MWEEKRFQKFSSSFLVVPHARCRFFGRNHNQIVQSLTTTSKHININFPTQTFSISSFHPHTQTPARLLLLLSLSWEWKIFYFQFVNATEKTQEQDHKLKSTAKKMREHFVRSHENSQPLNSPSFQNKTRSAILTMIHGDFKSSSRTDSVVNRSKVVEIQHSMRAVRREWNFPIHWHKSLIYEERIEEYWMWNEWNDADYFLSEFSSMRIFCVWRCLDGFEASNELNEKRKKSLSWSFGSSERVWNVNLL